MVMSCLRYCKSTIFQANHNIRGQIMICVLVVCDTAKVRFSKQITTGHTRLPRCRGCLRYCKSTIFQANHNSNVGSIMAQGVVCDTAKVRFSKQITTATSNPCWIWMLFAILQKYDFPSKSQLTWLRPLDVEGCLRYCKSTIFQANHNSTINCPPKKWVVCDTAKVRFSKQITT